VKRERDKLDLRDRRESEFGIPNTPDFKSFQPARFFRQSRAAIRLFCEEGQQFPNVHSVQIAPPCVTRQISHFPYPIDTLVETRLGTDLEIFQIP
jgi:hypothetical protein